MNEQLIAEVREELEKQPRRHRSGHVCNWRCYPGYCVEAPKREPKTKLRSQRQS